MHMWADTIKTSGVDANKEAITTQIGEIDERQEQLVFRK